MERRCDGSLWGFPHWIEYGDPIYREFGGFGLICQDCAKADEESTFEWHTCCECGQKVHRFHSAWRHRTTLHEEFICVDCYEKKYKEEKGSKYYEEIWED